MPQGGESAFRVQRIGILPYGKRMTQKGLMEHVHESRRQLSGSAYLLFPYSDLRHGGNQFGRDIGQFQFAFAVLRSGELCGADFISPTRWAGPANPY